MFSYIRQLHKRHQHFSWIFLSIICIFLPIIRVFAVEYSVNPIFPENQKEDISGYYSLMVKPGEKQTLEVDISNLEDEPLTVELAIINGMTTSFGTIEYSNVDNPLLPIPLSSIASVESEVTIAPNEQKRINIDLTLPDQEFNGIILGALEIQEKIDESTMDDEGVAGVLNRGRYIIAINLKENEEKVDLDIDLVDAKAGSLEGKNAILLNIENPKPQIIDRFYVDARITKKGSKEVLYKQTRKDMQMAPNSSFDYPIFLGTQPLKAGNYVAYIAASAQGGYEWDLEKEFTITKEQADEFNRLSVLDLDEDKSIMPSIIIAVIIILVIIGISFIVIKKNKQSKQSKVTAKRKRHK